MKRLLATLLTIALVLSVMSTDAFVLNAEAATSGRTGECVWSIEDGVLIISGQGRMRDYSYDYAAPYLEYDFDKVVIEDGVTRIGDRAFFNCSDLISIEIPESVTSIGNGAFYGCSGLTHVEIPESVTSIGDSAFSNSGLTSIEIPGGVTSIKDNTFYSCDNLRRVDIPEGVTSIAQRVFGWCSSLESIEIPESVTSIGTGAFEYSGLTSIEIPKGVTSIGEECFFACSRLTSIKIPEGVTYIHRRTFSNCDNLRSVEIHEGVTSIGEAAFSICGLLTSIVIPHTIEYIRAGAFYGCSNLDVVWYQGSEIDRERANMQIASDNGCLTGATWYYTFCNGEHLYTTDCDTTCDCGYERTITHNYQWKSNEEEHWEECVICGVQQEVAKHTYCHNCDVTCEECGWMRTVSEEHVFSLNENMTCENCGFSMRPDIPQLESKTNNSVTLVANSIYEYSNDGETWQDSNLFTGLLGNKEHTFYQRVKASVHGQASEKSEGLVIFLKDVQEAPGTPSVLSCTDTMAILSSISNGEYSCDGISWQTSNVFENLLPGTKYTFYQRYAETDTHLSSEASSGISVTTDKSKQTFIPDMPIAQSITSSSITLVIVEGCEYSKDGTTWQTSHVFSGLSCGTEYTFYQRYKETSTTYAGEKSACLTVKTDKGTQSPPSQPTLISKTYDTVTLTLVSGYEYSVDGINWQSNNVFTGLNPDTDYPFYQRKMETDTHYASPMSSSLEVRTNEKPTYKVGDLDGNDEVTDADALYLLYHTIFGDSYPIEQDCDYNNDGVVTDADALYLLYHTIFGESYPLN